MSDFEIPAEQRARYVQNRLKDLDVLKEDLKQKDFANIARKGHNIKGNALTFGFPDLGLIGERLEEAALAQKIEVIEKLLQEFTSWVSSRN